MKNTPRLGPSPIRGAADETGLTAAQRRTLAALRAAGLPQTVPELAEATGVHANTVRGHLDALVAGGLVERTDRRGGGRGRPSAVYTAEPAADHAVTEYRALATAFVEHLAAGPVAGEELRAVSQDVGRTWSEHRGTPGLDVDDARAEVVAVLGRLGFGPDDDLSTVRLRTCPLLDVAVEHPGIVCQVHLGLVDGLLRRSGDDTTRADLVPFAEPGACLLHLTRP